MDGVPWNATTELSGSADHPARRVVADAPSASVLSRAHSGVFAWVLLMLPTKVGYIRIMHKHICNPYCIDAVVKSVCIRCLLAVILESSS
mgnify:CR=1 FL=1